MEENKKEQQDREQFLLDLGRRIHFKLSDFSPGYRYGFPIQDDEWDQINQRLDEIIENGQQFQKTSNNNMLQEGKPIWVESLMTEKEIAECRRKYSTYNKSFRPIADFATAEYRWRWRMGEVLLPEEIRIMNKQIDDALLRAGITRKW